MPELVPACTRQLVCVLYMWDGAWSLVCAVSETCRLLHCGGGSGGGWTGVGGGVGRG